MRVRVDPAAGVPPPAPHPPGGGALGRVPAQHEAGRPNGEGPLGAQVVRPEAQLLPPQEGQVLRVHRRHPKEDELDAQPGREGGEVFYRPAGEGEGEGGGGAPAEEAGEGVPEFQQGGGGGEQGAVPAVAGEGAAGEGGGAQLVVQQQASPPLLPLLMSSIMPACYDIGCSGFALFKYYSMLREKEVESAVIQTGGWMIVSTYVGKAKPLSHDRGEEKVRLVVSSLDRAKEQEFIYVFELFSLRDCGLVEAKEFKDLKEFHYYLKFNPEHFRFKHRDGQGIVSVFFLTETKNNKALQKGQATVEIANGNRFILESPESKQRRMEGERNLLESERRAKEQLDKEYPEKEGYGEDTLVVQQLSTIQSDDAKKSKKILIRCALMDLESKALEMKNDREIEKIAIGGILQELPKLTLLESLTIQWHKLSTPKAITDVFEACKSLKNLRAISWDNLANGFSKESLVQFNKRKMRGIEEMNVFFNIWDEDNYFEESWWHPEHDGKYMGKNPIPSEEWLQFAEVHEALSSIWVPRQTPKDIQLLKMRQWRKLTLGYYDDQEMGQDYWNELKGSCPRQLVSLCLSRIKDLDEEAVQALIGQNRDTLEYLMINWCQKETARGLLPLGDCRSLRYLNFKHSPLQENKEVDFSFLRDMRRLEFLNIDNYKEAKKHFKGYIDDGASEQIKFVGLPRNQWVSCDLLASLRKKPNLTKLNLYNARGFDVEEAASILSEFKLLKVLNVGATEFDLPHILRIVGGLRYLKKLNISDIRCEKTMNKRFYEENWKEVRYPPVQKGYGELSSQEKEEFAFLYSNLRVADILPRLPRVTHLDIRNLGIDERPFADPKLLPLLRYVGCEFELYKKMQTLGRRGLAFV